MPEINKKVIAKQTDRNRKKTAKYILSAKYLKEDLDKINRRLAQECPFCYYTKQPSITANLGSFECIICHKVSYSASLPKDKICIKCAVEHGLCKHCGGHLDLDA